MALAASPGTNGGKENGGDGGGEEEEEEEEVGALTPFVWLLDMQGNLLCDWKELATMCGQLPRLSQLRINGNRMHMPTL